MKKIILALAIFLTPVIALSQDDGGAPQAAATAPAVVAEQAAPVVAPVAAAPSATKDINDDAQAVTVIREAVEAGKSGKWNLVIALVLMLIVYVFKNKGLLDRVPSEHIPTVTLLLGIASGLMPHLMSPSPDYLMGIISGVSSGLAASGLWETAGKKTLKGKKKE